MGLPVVHFEVMGQDGPALHRFYSDLFGWTINAENPMGYGVIEHSENHSTGGVGIGGGILGGMQPGQDGACFYVEVPDVESTLAEAERLGGTRIMGPQQVEGGRLVFGHLLDPEGHHVGIMQAGTSDAPAKIDPGAGRKGSPVVHFEIVGRDYATLERFYSTLFGWKPDRSNPVGYGMITREDNLSAAGIGIGGGIMAATEDTGLADYPGHSTWYVEVPNVEAALARAESLDGTRVMGPAPVPDGPTLGQLNDPEGHLIGLVQAE
jgi:predicted enzyme related to lactoylglutathione lyase